MLVFKDKTNHFIFSKSKILSMPNQFSWATTTQTSYLHSIVHRHDKTNIKNGKWMLIKSWPIHGNANVDSKRGIKSWTKNADAVKYPLFSGSLDIPVWYTLSCKYLVRVYIYTFNSTSKMNVCLLATKLEPHCMSAVTCTYTYLYLLIPYLWCALT